MPNRNGNAYGLTALFPVRDGVIDNVTYQERLRAYLADLPRDGKSPFARKAITHFSRFVVIDKFGFNGEPSLPDPLVSSWLLWTPASTVILKVGWSTPGTRCVESSRKSSCIATGTDATPTCMASCGTSSAAK